jgi:hypothetical protein
MTELVDEHNERTPDEHRFEDLKNVGLGLRTPKVWLISTTKTTTHTPLTLVLLLRASPRDIEQFFSQ